MQKSLLLPFMAFLCLLLTSCEKDDVSNDFDKNVYGNHPRTEKVPTALVGRWQYGVFSMTQYNDYTGGGNTGSGNETSVTYQINADGTGIEFFYNAIRSYYSVTETLGKRYGTYKVDEQTGVLHFYAASGNYYQVYTVNGGTSQKGEIKQYTKGSNDLYPNYKSSYEYTSGTNSQGQPILSLKYPSGTSYAFVKMD